MRYFPDFSFFGCLASLQNQSLIFYGGPGNGQGGDLTNGRVRGDKGSNLKMSAAKIFGASASLLLGKLALLGVSTAVARLVTRTFKNQEDGAFWDSELVRKITFFLPSGAAIEGLSPTSTNPRLS
jgi:hypothetical protein